LLAALAPNITIDYTLIVAAWGTKTYSASEFATLWLSEEHLGLKPLATQHLLAQPYFKSVTEDEIIVEWQQLASHGRRAEEDVKNKVKDTSNTITETSDGRSHMEHRFVHIEGKWKIQRITPSYRLTLEKYQIQLPMNFQRRSFEVKKGWWSIKLSALLLPQKRHRRCQIPRRVECY
jgi:hypothetical protein